MSFESRRIGLKISNEKIKEKILYILKNYFKEKIIIDLEINPGQEYNLIITDGQIEEKSKRNERILHLREDLKLDFLLEDVKLYLESPKRVIKLTVGVDPGKRIGAAVFCSNKLINAWISERCDELVFQMKRIAKSLQAKSVEVKIGKGPRYKEIIEKLCLNGFKEIELVDEKETTRNSPFFDKKLDKEIYSAIKIALKITL